MNKLLTKLAEITTELAEHQKRVVDKLKKDNLLIAHGMGSGKTLSSIAALDALGLPTKVVVPASLVNNFKKEIEKHTRGDLPHIDVQSIDTAISRGEKIDPNSFLIVDEAHLGRNPDTLRARWLKENIRNASRLALLTGTPVYNSISDIAPLINLVNKREMVAENPAEFEREFVRERKVSPGFLKTIFGVKPGIVKELSPDAAKKLEKYLAGKIDVHENKDNMPLREDIVKEVEMSPDQKQYYDYLANKMPWYLRSKIKGNLPPNKQESKALNTFMAGLRQAGLSIAPYNKNITPLQAAEKSSKLMAAMSSIKEKMAADPNFKAFIYSNYLEAGLNPMKALLEKEGIPTGYFHGGLTKEQKKNLVEEYNKGALKVLLGSPSAGEGLDLKGTKLIQVLEPHFNEPKIEQAIGRGIRIGSHSHLSEEERKVIVEKYLATLPKTLLNKLKDATEILGTKKDYSTDQWLAQRAAEKTKLTNDLKKILENISSGIPVN